MAVFNDSAAYSTVYLQSGILFEQDGHFFTTNYVDLGTTIPVSFQSMSSERSDVVSIIGGTINGVTIGPDSVINATFSGNVANGTITNSTITGGSINGTSIGQTTPAPGAFTSFNATSAGILGPLIAEGVSSSANAQPPSPTNSGITWGSSPTWAMQSFYDQSNSANNRAADMLFISGSIKFRFANDARNAFLDVFSIIGGQASGVTGITSTSGSGTWAHTGNLTTTSYIGSVDSGALPGFSGDSGAFLYAGNGFESLMMQRIGNTAGNRRACVSFNSAGLNFGFFNDQNGSQAPVITAAGGAASGITGVTSTSGSGEWAHTGSLSASGGLAGNTTVKAGIGSNSVQMEGAPNGQDVKIQALGVTDANVSIEISAKGTGILKFASPATFAGPVTGASSIDAGAGLRVKEGANAKQGIATLVAGTVTVANTSVTANSRIFLTVQSLGTVTDPKAVGVTARTAGTSFVIKSADATDTSVVAYEIFEPGA